MKHFRYNQYLNKTYLKPSKIFLPNKAYISMTSLQKLSKTFQIDNFGVNNAILLAGVDYGQTSIKCRDLACDVETPPLKNCKDLTMKLEVNYLFPT